MCRYPSAGVAVVPSTRSLGAAVHPCARVGHLDTGTSLRSKESRSLESRLEIVPKSRSHDFGLPKSSVHDLRAPKSWLHDFVLDENHESMISAPPRGESSFDLDSSRTSRVPIGEPIVARKEPVIILIIKGEASREGEFVTLVSRNVKGRNFN